MRIFNGTMGRNMSTLMSATIDFGGDGGMRGEVFGAQQAFFFRGDEHEQNRALELLRMCFQAGGHVQDQSAAGTVVHGAVVDAVAVDGRADADVVDVRGKDDEFVFEHGIGARQFGDDVGGFERLS